MNNTRKEKISAFLDNDMHSDEIMSFSLSAEEDDARIAQRYQMMGDALRGELSESSFVDVSAAVREALADENIATQMPASKPVAGTEPAKASGFGLSAWFRPVAGMAVAASVALVMVVTFSAQHGESGVSAPLASNTSAAPVTTVAAGNKAAAVGKPASDRSRKAGQEFNPYINQHLEYASQEPLQGRMPYVRAVSYESGQAPQ
ncbi:MAG TPA: hypothetical protein ENJ11_04160 [Gammaproteobacteria bacterium]|nr:hypothetical protein [Gammaproteobacteria bacterium]